MKCDVCSGSKPSSSQPEHRYRAASGAMIVVVGGGVEMACNCGSSASAGAQASQPEVKYEVRYPNGTKVIVTGEHAAKVEATMAGAGATYSRL